jgi:hypothetical protein
MNDIDIILWLMTVFVITSILWLAFFGLIVVSSAAIWYKV